MRFFLRSLLLVFLCVPALGQVQAQTPTSAGGWQVASTQDIAIEAFDVSMSPNGSLLAVATDGQTLCIQDIETLEGPCAEIAYGIELGSLVWAPDSSAIAFQDYGPEGYGSNIHVVDADTGADRNLTEAIGTATPVIIGNDVFFHSSPAWSPDSTELVFARTVSNDIGSVLMTVPAAGGEPVELEGTSFPGVSMAYFRMGWSADGTIFYSRSAGEADDGTSGIWRWRDGQAELIFDGASNELYPLPQIEDVAADGSWLIGTTTFPASPGYESREDGSSQTFILDTESGELVPFESRFPILGETLLPRYGYPPRFSSGGSALIYGAFLIGPDVDPNKSLSIQVASTTGDPMTVEVFAGVSEDIHMGPFNRGLTLASNNTLLIPHAGEESGSVVGATLITLEPAG